MSGAEEFRLIVCGGRDFTDRQFVFDTLRRIHIKRRIGLLIEGGASSLTPDGKLVGADTFAWEWAVTWRVPVQTFHADWDSLGKAAGPIRNAQMLTEGHANGCLAFKGNRGTHDMLGKAYAAGVTVMTPGWSWSPAQRQVAQGYQSPAASSAHRVQEQLPELGFG